MKPNPSYPRLLERLTRSGSIWQKSWEGECWRYQDINFPSESEILSGEGAKRNGGRLNVKGSFRVVYGSTKDQVALKESAARSSKYGLIVRSPRILVCLDLRLQKVLDLGDAGTRRGLKITLAGLGAEDWEALQDKGIESLGQGLGRAAYHAGFEAVLISSFAHRGGRNIAIFPENLGSSSRITVVQGEKLRRLQAEM